MPSRLGPPSGNPRAHLGIGSMPDEHEILTRTEVLALLSQKAREGQTGALIALERALRIGGDEEDDIGDEIDRILGRQDE
jgi:hypothetical protein